MMENENIEMYDLAMLLNRSKSMAYKNDLIKRASSLLRFLHDNNLLVEINPFDKDGELKLDTVIKRKNLTDEGYQLFKKGVIDGWLTYLSRSNAPDKNKNISRLEKGLKKIREE